MFFLLSTQKQFISKTSLFKILKITPFVILLIFVTLLFSKCTNNDDVKSGITLYINSSGKDIIIQDYFSFGRIGNKKKLSNNETLRFSRSKRGSYELFLLPTSDSITIIYDDSIQITHGSKTGIDSCNGRNLRCFNSFDNKVISNVSEQYTYTFTEADYEFAKNR